MNKNKWFKHYNDSSQGLTIRTLLDNKDYEAVTMWWIVHELISRFESFDARGKVTISENTLAREMNMKPSKSRKVLARISMVSQMCIQYETDEKNMRNISFLSPNWLKLQETRGGKRSAKNEQKKSKNPTDIRRKTKDIRNKNIICDLPAAESLAGEGVVDCDDRITPQDLFELWNNKAHPSLPRAIVLTAKRRNQINARIKENPEAEFWQDAIAIMNSSKFCLGQVSISGLRTKPWLADFDWFIKPDSAIKLIEGKYTK